MHFSNENANVLIGLSYDGSVEILLIFFFIGKIHLKNIYLPPSVEDIPFLVKALLFKLYEKSVIHFKFYFV